MAGDLPGGDAHRLAIDSPDEVARLEQLAADNLPAQAQPDNLAYVIFTSGSTGRPKGTLLRHRGIMNLALENQVVYGFTPQDRILQFASSSFDASVYEFVQTLTAGAALVLADQQCMLPGAGLLEQLRKERVTAVCMPPSILAALPAQELPDLRIVTAAGEACPAEVVDRWAPGRRFFNAYGPTECTVWTTVEECFAGRGNPTIGRPLVNNQAYILNPHLEPQPVGVAGELYFASPGVAVGYLNRPELTAERFVPNPFSDAFDATLYRTGDLARYCSDGRIEFLGRIDHQVKLRGYRIELEEIEAALRQHVAIEQALVMARNDMGRDPQLVAYVVPKPGATSDAGELRDWLKDRLPAFMLPAAYLVLKEFPMTVNGKVDRAALPAPDSARRDLKQEYVAPRNPVEESLAQIVAEVLGLERVGIQDNFFDLGGASIQALRVVERATQAGYPLTPEMLFKHQTVCELAAAQQAEQQAAAKNAEAKQDTAATIPQQPAAMAAQPAEQTPRAAPAAHEPAAAPPANMVIESLGVYLPERVVSTDEVLQGCSRELAFPLERMTGIRSRRMVSEGEYSIDLARRAIEDCLRGSKYQPAEIDLLICCNISRCDGPDFAFSYEPTTALRLKHEFGFARAMAFDISNACAGFFTGLKIADSFLKAGVIRRAMVVSGEHITHLTRTAQWEIDGFMDPRLACLTLGDSGAAVIVETANQPGVGFHELELYTLGRYSNLCVAKLTDQPHGGATMFTDPVKASAVTIQQSVAHAQHVLARRQWNENNVHHVIMHQTSETTLDGAIQELNRSLGKEMCGRHNVIYNIAERGNTATTTHWVALMDQVLSRRIRSGQNIVFSTTGSGQTVGTALYTFDDLPERILAAREQRPHQGLRSGTGAPPQREPAGILSREPIGPRVRIAGVGTAWAGQTAAETMSLLQAAGEKCLANWGRDRSDVDLLIHAGVYRSEFVSEPALAAMAAGALGINDSIDSPQAKKTFALDLMDGAAGFLDACYVAEQMIRSGAHRHAMVMTSEIENNALARPDHLLGLEEGGAAVILEPSDDGSGLEAYLFKSFTLHLDAMESHTAMVDGIGALEISRRADLEDRYLECIAATVSELLTAQGLTADDLAVILPPQISKAFADRLANALQVPVEKVIDASGTGDAFTCSLARGWEKLRERGLPARGQRGLIISAGAGIQVGCALYRF
jgi:amino acid adenylation domain-containing protein